MTIDLLNVSKSFGSKKIFTDLNLIFESGKSYALIGGSGSGKSTLLNIIGRLEKIDSGNVLVDKQDIWKIKERTFFKNTVGYPFNVIWHVAITSIYLVYACISNGINIAGTLLLSNSSFCNVIVGSLYLVNPSITISAGNRFIFIYLLIMILNFSSCNKPLSFNSLKNFVIGCIVNASID